MSEQKLMKEFGCIRLCQKQTDSNRHSNQTLKFLSFSSWHYSVATLTLSHFLQFPLFPLNGYCINTKENVHNTTSVASKTGTYLYIATTVASKRCAKSFLCSSSSTRVPYHILPECAFPDSPPICHGY